MPRVAIFAVPSKQHSAPAQAARAMAHASGATAASAAPGRKHRGKQRRRPPQMLRRNVAVVNDGFACRLRLPSGSWRVWAETIADARNVAGSSPQLLLKV
jgi:hypothetical protein